MIVLILNYNSLRHINVNSICITCNHSFIFVAGWVCVLMTLMSAASPWLIVVNLSVLTLRGSNKTVSQN